jgi:hypothetical protein
MLQYELGICRQKKGEQNIGETTLVRYFNICNYAIFKYIRNSITI